MQSKSKLNSLSSNEFIKDLAYDSTTKMGDGAQSKKDVFERGVKDYSINLLWLNKDKNPGQTFIHNADTKENLYTKFLEPAVKWKKANPEADVNIWYDAKLHTEEAVAFTKKALEESTKKPTSFFNNFFSTFFKKNTIEEKIESAEIKFKDINDIPIVKLNPDLFDTTIPLYFRIDILKLVICLHSLTNESKDSAIFADLDTGDLRQDQKAEVTGTRLNKEELFDEESMNNLKKYGIIANAKWKHWPENKFLQVVNNDYIVEALRVNVNVCLNVITNALNADLNSLESAFCQELELAFCQKKYMKEIYNVAFHSTIKGVTMYYQSVIEDGITVRADIVGKGSRDEWVKYDPQTHGYNVLGNFGCNGFSRADLFFLVLSTNSDSKNIQSKTIKQFLPVYEIMSYETALSGKILFSVKYAVRETYTRDGGAHTDKVTLPKEGHEPFVATFWENPLVDKNIVQEDLLLDKNIDFSGDINSYFNDDSGV